MDSTQSISTERTTPTFETSVGSVSAVVRSRDGLAIQKTEGCPIVYLELERRGDDWELESDPALCLVEHARKVPAPAALVDEFVKLG
jgi:hypothetical protein